MGWEEHRLASGDLTPAHPGCLATASCLWITPYLLPDSALPCSGLEAPTSQLGHLRQPLPETLDAQKFPWDGGRACSTQPRNEETSSRLATGLQAFATNLSSLNLSFLIWKMGTILFFEGFRETGELSTMPGR